MKKIILFITLLFLINIKVNAQWQNISISRDSFHTWAYMRDVHFVNKDTGFVWDPMPYNPVMNTGGSLFRTTTGGNSWHKVFDNNYPFDSESFFFNPLFYSGNHFLFMTGAKMFGDSLALIETKDGGKNFTVITVKFSGQIFKGYDHDLFNVKTYYKPEFTEKSSDFGKTWHVVDTNPIYNIHFVDSLTGFGISNLNGSVISKGKSKFVKTIDGGDSWDTVATTFLSGFSSKVNDIYFDFKFITPDTGYCARNVAYSNPTIYSDSLFRTTDGGITWQSIMNGLPPVGYHNTPFTPKFPTSKIGYVYHYNGSVYKTKNSGNIWHLLREPTAPCNQTWYMQCVSNDVVVIWDINNGCIFKTDIGGGDTITDVIPTNSAKNNEKILIYPNPSTNNVLFEFSEKTQLPANARIINSIGQIVFEQSISNDYFLKLDASNWKRGLYIFEFSNKTGATRQKFVLE